MNKIVVSWVAFFWLALAASPHPSAAAVVAESVTKPSASEELVGAHLERLDRELQNRLWALERQTGVDRATWRREMERFERHLRHLETRIRSLGSDATEALLEKTRSIDRKLSALEHAVAAGAFLKSETRETRSEPVVRQPLKGGEPANDDCTDALPIGNGTFLGTTVGATNDGSSPCGGGGAPDVWFRYSSPVGGEIFADTAGSDFDTVLSVHTGVCPGTQETNLTCNDNAIGLQSVVDFYLDPGAEVLIRVSGFGGDSGQFTLNVGVGGAVSGRVTAAATGEPLPSVEVRLFSAQSFFSRSASTDPAGNYTVTGLPGGTYFATAGFSTNFIVELYENLPCPDGDCDVADGAPVEVALGSVTQGIDFSLDLGGSLQGTVTDVATGSPLPDVDLELFDGEGRHLGHRSSDAAGRYAFFGLTAGSYFVVASSFDFQDEVYDDLPCSSFSCDPTSGTPVQVGLGDATSGIDFALAHLGAISGVVTDEATGDPIPFVDIEVTDATFSFGGRGFADELGRYTVGGLPPGSYFIRTDNSSEFRDEIYDDIPCIGFDCDVTSGTPVIVELSSTTPNIDFALNRLGAISGVVIDEVTGEPLPFFRVRAQDASGQFGNSVRTGASGNYLLNGLVPGVYFIQTDERSEFQDELYDDIPCPFRDCDPTAGTPVPVSLETTTPGIDFALRRLGSISGSVTDEATGEPLPSYRVRAQHANGQFGDSVNTDTSGNYLLNGLVPGAYFIQTDEFSGFQNKVYDDIPCLFNDCDPTSGTPVPVSLETTTPGIDFALRQLGSISGTVTDAVTGAPIPSLGLRVENLDTFFDRFGRTDAVGHYVMDGLPAGNYVVFTDDFGEFQNETYDDVPCSSNGCDLAAGLPVAVSLETTTAGIDFVLERLGSISGTVIDQETGEPIPDADVEIFDQSGSFAGSVEADATGEYAVTGLLPGTHFAQAHGGQEYVVQLYDDASCPFANCNVTTGTPIDVALNTTVEGIDFALRIGGTITGSVRSVAGNRRLNGAMLVWDASGRLVAGVSTDSEGRYALQGLIAGTYFVSTDDFFSRDPFTRYNDELYDDMPCPNGTCDPTIGTPVAVSLGAITLGIDFSLIPIVEPSCFPSPTTLCLNENRFQVDLQWRDGVGQSGVGQGFELTDDTGYFWFFDPDNVELVVKVLDGCFDPFNAFWVFAGGLTDVEVDLTVTDTVTGEVRTYGNALGTAFAPLQDLGAFATCDASLQGEPAGAVSTGELESFVSDLDGLLDGAFAAAFDAAAGDTATVLETTVFETTVFETSAFEDVIVEKSPVCAPDATTLCLSGGRFEIVALWDTGQQIGDGQATLLTGDTGYFWFFSSENVEAVVKVLDACDLPGFNNFWVFAAGLTDVEVTLRVTDTETFEVREWVNPLGTAFQPIRETGAFMTCP